MYLNEAADILRASYRIRNSPSFRRSSGEVPMYGWEESYKNAMLEPVTFPPETGRGSQQANARAAEIS
jgi:hypothetical protein